MPKHYDHATELCTILEKMRLVLWDAMHDAKEFVELEDSLCGAFLAVQKAEHQASLHRPTRHQGQTR